MCAFLVKWNQFQSIFANNPKILIVLEKIIVTLPARNKYDNN